MYRPTSLALSGANLTAGSWKMEVNAPESASFFTASDDVEARLRVVREFVAKSGGTINAEDGHLLGSGVDVTFKLPGSAWWPNDWGIVTRDEDIIESKIRSASEAARAETDYASQQATLRTQEAMTATRAETNYASQQADLRIAQAKSAALTVGISLIALSAVAYILVKE